MVPVEQRHVVVLYLLPVISDGLVFSQALGQSPMQSGEHDSATEIHERWIR